MNSKSFPITMRFKGQFKRYIFVTDKVDIANELWKKANDEVTEFAEKEEDEITFWKTIPSIFKNHGFWEVKE